MVMYTHMHSCAHIIHCYSIHKIHKKQSVCYNVSFGVPVFVCLDGCSGKGLLKVFSEDLRDTNKTDRHNERKASEGGGEIPKATEISKWCSLVYTTLLVPNYLSSDN